MTTTKQQHIQYLRHYLIPDLVNSGSIATAVDFEVACRFMEKETDKVVFPVGSDEEYVKWINEWKSRP